MGLDYELSLPVHDRKVRDLPGRKKDFATANRESKIVLSCFAALTKGRFVSISWIQDRLSNIRKVERLKG